MLAEMTSEQFTEWLGYMRCEPLPEERMEVYMAQIAMAGLIPHSKRKLSLSDFMVDFDQEHARQESNRKTAAMLRRASER